MIACGSLYPAVFHFRHFDGGPLWYLLHRWDSWSNYYLIYDIWINTTLYIPFGVFGLFAATERRKGVLQKAECAAPVLYAFVLSFLIELLQIYEPARESSSVDVLSDTAGAAIGVVLALLIRPLLIRRRRKAGTPQNDTPPPAL